jgi:hypothetical protein
LIATAAVAACHAASSGLVAPPASEADRPDGGSSVVADADADAGPGSDDVGTSSSDGGAGGDATSTSTQGWPRCGQHSATLLQDGRVLVIGSCTYDEANPNPCLDRSLQFGASIFDPALDRWSGLAGAPPIAAGHRAVLLDDGRVLTAGGLGGDGRPTAEAFFFDPGRARFEDAPPLAMARSGHAMTRLSGGRALVLGGSFLEHVYDGTPQGTWQERVTASVELYDPSSSSWSEVEGLLSARQDLSATRLLDDRVVVIGGRGDFLPQETTVEVRDPGTGQWSQSGTLESIGHTSFALSDGTMLVVGTPFDARSNSALNAWATFPLSHCQVPLAVSLDDGGILVALGSTPYHLMTHDCTAHIYDPFANVWRAASGLPDGLGPLGTGTLLRDGRVLIIASKTVAVRVGD